MESQKQSPYNHTCVDAGVDYITATASPEGARSAFRFLGDAILQTEREAGVDIKPASLRDYRGFRTPGLFVGDRRADSIIVLSGSRCPPHWQSVARVASNVSRLDLQASVWTHGEQPRLSRWYYQRAVRQSPSRGRPRSYSLIQSHPQGDTLYVGKRQSDYYGRVYDWASAHKQGEPRTIWRYEVELKRQVALAYTSTLLAAGDDRNATERIVHGWYSAKGIKPTWSIQDCAHPEQIALRSTERQTLAWFETSLRKTVATQIRRHGLTAVLDALGLSGVVIAKPKEGANAYATFTASVVSSKGHRRAARATD